MMPNLKRRVGKIEERFGMNKERDGDLVFDVNGRTVRLSQRECDEFLQGLAEDNLANSSERQPKATKNDQIQRN